jgi:hypothetical protein
MSLSTRDFSRSEAELNIGLITEDVETLTKRCRVPTIKERTTRTFKRSRMRKDEERRVEGKQPKNFFDRAFNRSLKMYKFGF